jgi:hypothetical protein
MEDNRVAKNMGARERERETESEKERERDRWRYKARLGYANQVRLVYVF